MAKPTLDEIWRQTVQQPQGMPAVMIDPQLGSVNAQNFNQDPQPQFQEATMGQQGGFQEAQAFGPEQEKVPFWKKAANFVGEATGIKGVGDALNAPAKAKREQDAITELVNQATALINESKKYPTGDPRRRQLIAQARQLSDAAREGADISAGAIPTNAQGLASVGKVGLTVGSFGLGAPASVAGRLAMGTATGAGFGGLDAAEKGGDLGDIAKGAAIGGATGLAVGGLFEGVRWAAQNLPKRLMGGVSGLTNKQMASPKGQKALEYALKNKKIGTSSMLMKQGEAAIDKLDDEITKTIASTTGKVRINDVAQNLADDMNNAGWQTGRGEVLQRIRDTFPNAAKYLSKKSLSLQEANELRKIIDKAVRPGSWLNSQSPASQEFAKALRRQLAETVKTAAPTTRQMFSDYANELTLLEGLRQAEAKLGNNKILSLGDLVLGGGGFAGAGPVGAAGAIALNKTLHSTLVNSVAANMVQPISNILIKLQPAEQQLIVQAIANATR